MISLERNDVQQFRKEIWSMSSVDREKFGRCLSNMVLEKEVKPSDRNNTDSNITAINNGEEADGVTEGKEGFLYTFIKGINSYCLLVFLDYFIHYFLPLFLF